MVDVVDVVSYSHFVTDDAHEVSSSVGGSVSSAARLPSFPDL